MWVTFGQVEIEEHPSRDAQGEQKEGNSCPLLRRRLWVKTQAGKS